MNLFALAKPPDPEPDRLDLALEAISRIAQKSPDQLARFTLQLADDCPIPVWVTDENDIVIYVNPAYEDEFKDMYVSFLSNKKEEKNWPQVISNQFAKESEYVKSRRQSIYFTQKLDGKEYFVVKFPTNGTKVCGFCIPTKVIASADEHWRKLRAR